MSQRLPEYTQEELNELFARTLCNSEVALDISDDDYEILSHISSGMYVLKKED